MQKEIRRTAMAGGLVVLGGAVADGFDFAFDFPPPLRKLAKGAANITGQFGNPFGAEKQGDDDKQQEYFLHSYGA
jgi:hypothetical protein